MEQLVPKDFPNRELPAVEKGHLAIEIGVAERLQPGNGLLVNPSVSGGEKRYFPWTFEIRWLVFEAEPPVLDPKGQTRIDFAQVPGELANRPAVGVGPEIVLPGGQSLEQPDGICSFSVPDSAKALNFIWM